MKPRPGIEPTTLKIQNITVKKHGHRQSLQQTSLTSFLVWFCQRINKKLT